MSDAEPTDEPIGPHLDAAAIAAGLDHVRAAPADAGRVSMIVRRPAIDEREILPIGELSTTDGLVGDTWAQRGSRRTADGGAHPDMQLNVINTRFAALIAPDPAAQALAGDQLHLDLDLSETNLPPGTRLGLGTAVIEITAEPHRGCAKFRRRFGADALKAVNSPEGIALNLRGVNAKVIVDGEVRPGDAVHKLDA